MRLALTLALAATAAPLAAAAEPAAVDPARDALPILRRACVECHGPQKQKGGLRLDSRAAALRGGDGGPAVAPGKPGESELLRRVALGKGDDGVMPARGEPLTKAQVEALRAWVAAGAPWPETATPHWAYVKPTRPAPPAVKAATWVRNPIDRFVLARLEKEGLSPSPQAAKEVLLRRVTFDLTGLPPTPAEVAAFVGDASPDAYEKAVDRLLASPQFGVRWAKPWLDAARYADSHGFQRDDFRDLWPYRDWVIDALNADMPFDRFTIEQLAGDLLPNPTQGQLVATGFNRSAPTNVEAGSDPEETRVNQVFDRVNTLGTVWLGTTFECAQCHDHKYDPITQKDYYRLYAFFNNTEVEADRANPKVPGSIRFLGPALELKDPAVEAERAGLAAGLAAARRKLAARAKAVKPDPAWEAEVSKKAGEAPREHVLDVAGFDSLNGATHEVLADKSVLLSGEAPDKDTYTVTVKTTLTGIRAVKLEALTDPSLPGTGPGRGDAVRANFVLNTFSATAAPAAGGKSAPVKFVKAQAGFAQKRFDPKGAIDADPKTGWAVGPKFRQPHWAVFETAGPVGSDGGTVLTFTLVQNFGSSRTIGRLRLSAITGDPLPAGVVEALRTPAGKRTDAQAEAVRAYRLSLDPEYQKLEGEVRRIDAAVRAVKSPTTLVMRELPEPRETHLLKRGDFRAPGEAVAPATPAVLPSMSPDGRSRPTRLDLARWLASPDNPLTARVTVNRFWAELFGRGLVPTPEDFGVQGERPTHPELLDWLAVEFTEGGWSQKKLLRLMVTSAVYRQSSRATAELLARDDKNLLLARGPRFRLDAEAVRDNALAVAGLLSLKRGGPPVRPYQPDGLWVKVGGQRYDYVVSPGEEKYRRGLYVVRKRAAPYPSFVNFDADNRMACRVARPRSNTPLQALTLLNDPVYVEAALAFARRVLTEEPGAGVEERIAHAFRVAVARPPRPDEAAVLKALFDAEKAAKARDTDAAKELIGAFPVPPGVAPAEFAAWYAVCAALLNLDETITRG